MTHSYTEAGTYDATASVTDDGGPPSSVTTSVDVLPAPADDAVYAQECADPGAVIEFGGIARTANAALLASGWDTSRGRCPWARWSSSCRGPGGVRAVSTLPALGFSTNAIAPTAPGEYTVSLIGTLESTTFDVPCPIPPTRPIADAGGPYRIEAGSSLLLDGSASVGARSYAWDFGDGVTGVGIDPEHVYTTPGRYIVQLVVGDQVSLNGATAAALHEGVFGRTSDVSVLAVSSRAVVEVVQVPPSTPTTTTSVTTTSVTTTTAVPTDPTAPTQPTTTVAQPSPLAPTTTQRPVSGTLPRTGSSPGVTFAGGAGLLGLGAVALIVARRPRGRRPARVR